MTSAPVLALPDFSLPFFLESDASGSGVGAVLCQQGHPIVFFSQILSPRMQGAFTYHREMFSITHAVKKWRHYLLGHKYFIITDQKSICELMSQTIQTPEEQYWLSKLIGFHFEIRYRPGRDNKFVDALSRVHCYDISLPQFNFMDEVCLANQSDIELMDLRIKVQGQNDTYRKFSIKGDFLYFNYRFVIPSTGSLKHKLFAEFHASVQGVHAGFHRSFRRLASNFYWKNMRADIRSFLAQCMVANELKPAIWHQQVFSSPYQFHLEFGRIFF